MHAIRWILSFEEFHTQTARLLQQ